METIIIVESIPLSFFLQLFQCRWNRLLFICHYWGRFCSKNLEHFHKYPFYCFLLLSIRNDHAEGNYLVMIGKSCKQSKSILASFRTCPPNNFISKIEWNGIKTVWKCLHNKWSCCHYNLWLVFCANWIIWSNNVVLVKIVLKFPKVELVLKLWVNFVESWFGDL